VNGTVGPIIAWARARHPFFEDETRYTNRAAVLFLSTLQVELLQNLADALVSRLDEARSVAAVVSGSLVGVDSTGALYQVTTADDGYAVSADPVTGALYLDSSIKLAYDPYSTGFPLPDDNMLAVTVYARLRDSLRYLPVTIVPESDIARRVAWGSAMFAFINHWRLIPVRNPPDNTGPSIWDRVDQVTIAWVPHPAELSTGPDWATQELIVPTAYDEVLKYSLASEFALKSIGFPDRQVSAAFAAQLQAQAEQRRSGAIGEARKDHQPLKFYQTRRNR
jgi:hypothetical protein